MGLALQFLLRQRGLSATPDAPIGAFPGTQGLCGPGRGTGLDDASGPERRADPAHPGTTQDRSADRPSHLGALAAMVAGHLCPRLFLERGSRSLHAPAVRKDAAQLVA